MASSALALTQFQWKQRLLVAVAPSNAPLFSTITAFQNAYQCDILDRDLHVILADIGSDQWRALPERMRDKPGLYLVGYDGGIKDYSQDDALLGRLNVVIDQMPMRRRKLASRNGQDIC